LSDGANLRRVGAGRTLAHDLRGFRPQWRFFGLEVREDIAGVLVIGGSLHSRHLHFAGPVDSGAEKPPQFRRACDLMPPHTGEVGLAIESARRRRGQVGLAVARPGCSWRGKVQPLCVRACRKKREQDERPLMLHLQPPAPNATLAGGREARSFGETVVLRNWRGNFRSSAPAPRSSSAAPAYRSPRRRKAGGRIAIGGVATRRERPGCAEHSARPQRSRCRARSLSPAAGKGPNFRRRRSALVRRAVRCDAGRRARARCGRWHRRFGARIGGAPMR